MDHAVGHAAPSTRLLEVMHEVRTRLRPICADLPADVFDTMVERVARLQVKYEGTRRDA